MKKITLSEFFESKNKLAIHCKTKEEAKQLLKSFAKTGYCQVNKLCYDSINYWNDERQYTCYDNMKRCSTIKFYKSHDYKIYEFDEVDLDN